MGSCLLHHFTTVPSRVCGRKLKGNVAGEEILMKVWKVRVFTSKYSTDRL